MAPPFAYKTVVGTYKSPDGTNVAGSVRFVPSATVYDSSGNIIVPPTPITATLASGALSVLLLVTDDPTTNPTGWTWQVTELFAGGREWEFQLPTASASTVNLADLAPASTVDATWQYVLLAANEAWKAGVEAWQADVEAANAVWESGVEADVTALTGRVDTVESAVSIATTVDLLNMLAMGAEA